MALSFLFTAILSFFVREATAQSPGGVSTGIGLWLKADNGVFQTGGAVTQWTDQSAAGRNAAQVTASAQPTYYQGNIINFNPAIKFDGANDFFTTPSIFTAATNGSRNLKAFSINTIDVSGHNTIFAQVNNGTNATSFRLINGSAYWDVPYGYRAVATYPHQNGVADLWSLSRTQTLATVSQNKKQLDTYANTMGDYPSNSLLYIGVYPGNGGTYLEGKIGELVIYNNSATLTPIQTQQIESYLALKWGITLDQTTAYDYLASDGTTKMWTAATGGTFKNNIAGIGRDNTSALNQKQSNSENVGPQLVMAIGTAAADNASNTGTIADKNFLSWADNGGALTPTTVVNTPTLTEKWLLRKWQVQETGSVGSTQVLAPVELFNLLGSGGTSTFMVVADDAGFTTNVVKIPLTASSVLRDYLAASQDFNGTKYITFGKTFVPEICNNAIDDDGDGLIDCLDPDCSGSTMCTVACATPGPRELKTDAGFNRAFAFRYTGADQHFIVPSCVTYLKAKVWGGGGGTEQPYGGAGGFVSGNFTVAPGDQLSLMVGKLGASGVYVGAPGNFSPSYGFGGGTNGANGSGGGLSGIFTGNAAIANTSDPRAILVAGGGSGGATSDVLGNFPGYPGGGLVAGGNSYMQGLGGGASGASSATDPQWAGSGGGYRGGVPNYNGGTSRVPAGTSYIAPSVLSPLNLYSTNGYTAPNKTDLHYEGTVANGQGYSLGAGGNGLIVLQFNLPEVISVAGCDGVVSFTLPACIDRSTLTTTAAGTWSGNTFTSTPYAPGSTYCITLVDANGFVLYRFNGAIPTLPASLTATLTTVSTICSGNAVNINYTTNPTGVPVIWTRMPGSLSGVGSLTDFPTATAPNPTSYTYTATVGTTSSCPSQTVVTVVTVNPVPEITPSDCSQTICSGTTGAITFTSSVSATINWLRVEDGATGIGNISQSFTTPGTYTYKIWGVSLPPASCPSSTTITCIIVVTPGLTVTAFANSATVCTGSPLSLSAAVVPAAGNYTYSWTGPNGYTGSGANPTVAASAVLTQSGTYTVVVTTGTCSGTATVSVTVQNCCDLVVNATPISVTSCSSPNTGAIIITYTGSSSYQYSLNGGGFQSLAASPVTINNLAAGSYTLVVQAVGTPSCSQTAVVTVNPPTPPVLNAVSNSPLCAGGTLSLSATSGYSTYTWSATNGFTSSQQNPSIPNATTATSGVYTVKVTNAVGCTAIASTTVVVANQPSLTVTAAPSQTICSGQSTTLNVGGSNGAPVTWTNNLGQTGTGTTINFAGVLNNSGQPQTITYVISANAGACSDSKTIDITVNPAPFLIVIPQQAVICAVEQTNLVATVTPNTATITWSRLPQIPTPFTGTGTGSVTVNELLPAGNYTYTFTATGGGCTSSPVTVPLTVNN